MGLLERLAECASLGVGNPRGEDYCASHNNSINILPTHLCPIVRIQAGILSSARQSLTPAPDKSQIRDPSAELWRGTSSCRHVMEPHALYSTLHVLSMSAWSWFPIPMYRAHFLSFPGLRDRVMLPTLDPVDRHTRFEAQEAVASPFCAHELLLLPTQLVRNP